MEINKFNEKSYYSISKPIFLNIPDGQLGEHPEHRKLIKDNNLDSWIIGEVVVE